MNKASMLPTPDDLTLDEIQSRFSTDEAARQYLEEIRWPNGVVCPHCQNNNQELFWNIKANALSKVREGLRQCGACKKQFTVTVGTIFEDSKIPLRKWLVAWYLICSSKKGISSLQIQRMLGLGSYRSALFMTHRIRYALKDESFSTKLSGVVEVDETYVGGKETREEIKARGSKKTAVVSLVERGGTKRSMVMQSVTNKNLKAAILEHVQINSRVVTDDSHVYTGTIPLVYQHTGVKHSAKEYSRTEKDGFVTHSNTVESSFSLLKRGIVGTFHHVSKKHLGLYIAEFDHRWNHRKVSDGKRTVEALKKAEGKRLTYKPLTKKKK